MQSFSDGGAFVPAAGCGPDCERSGDCAITIYFAAKIRKYLEGLQAVDSTFVEVLEKGSETREAAEGVQEGEGTEQ